MKQKRIYNWWLELKPLCSLFCVLAALYVVCWFVDFHIFGSMFEDVLWQYESMLDFNEEYWQHLTEQHGTDYVTEWKEGRITPLEPNALRNNAGEKMGLAAMILGMLFVSAMTVHKDSFFYNWNVTIRRIPGYRRFYLNSKFVAVFVPGMMFLLYDLLQAVARWSIYKRELPANLMTRFQAEQVQFFAFGAPWKTFFWVGILAVCFLLGNLALQNLKKGVAGLFAAILGLGVCGLYVAKPELNFFWVPVVGLAVIAVLIRQVYKKM